MAATAKECVDAHTLSMTVDEIWPRTPEFRYRLYAVVGDERALLAAAPDGAGIGVAIVTLNEDQKEIGCTLSDLGAIGILDVMPNGEPSPTGEWIVNPWQRPS